MGSYYITELKVNLKDLCTLHAVVECLTGVLRLRNMYGFMEIL